MKRTILNVATALMLLLVLATFGLAGQNIWVTAYYAGWSQGYNNTGLLPAQNIDYTALTHINHFALVPNANGTLDDASNGVSAFNATAVTTSAHAAGKKVLITVGGWATDVAFRGATTPAVLPTFVNNLITLMKTRGYDGIDVDWERLEATDAAQYSAFITALRTAMNVISPRPLLTTAEAWQPAILASVAAQLDQINIMTYDMSGAWGGWVTWHNSPLYDGGAHFPSGGALPSSDGEVNAWSAAGIPIAKLGIGIDFYGYVWTGGAGTSTGGATAPRQTWTTAPTVAANIPYSTIMQSYYQPQYYRFDADAQVSYLSIDNAGSATDQFISYDDTATCARKIDYARSKGIGGVIIWELSGGYRPNMPAGQQDVLLQSIKRQIGNGSVATVPVSPIPVSPAANATGTAINSLTFSWTEATAGTSFHFQFSSNSAFSSFVSDQTGLSGTTATVSGMANSTKYYWRVNASNAAGTSAWSNTSSFTTAAAGSVQDVIVPVVSFTAPASAATVSGTTAITVNATDNIGVVSVQFAVDGVAMGAPLTVAPYTSSWNTATAPNGAHALSAVATDSAGNKATATRTVTVSNAAVVGGSGAWVYQDGLASPWMNTSYNATLNFSNTAPVYAGTSSIQVAQGTWGAFSIHNGSWAPSAGVSATAYTNLQFAIHGGPSGIVFNVVLENDAINSFPTVSGGSVAANTWKLVTIPVTQLDPAGYNFHRIDILETSGQPRTYSIDNIQLTGYVDTTPPTIAFATPLSGATVSGTTPVSANATDNIKVTSVQFKLDGANLGSPISVAPFAYSWNTTLTTNGTHTLSATASDSAGNISSDTRTLTVSNVSAGSSTTAWVFQDNLASPWINASYNATLTFANPTPVYAGSSSMKVVQGAWGAVSFHNGSWAPSTGLNPSSFSSLQFAVFGGASGVSINVVLENDALNSFPTVKAGSVAANVWKVFTVPISQLDPAGFKFHRIDILETSGAARTFYLDNIQLLAPVVRGKSEKLTSESGELPAEESATVPTTVPAEFKLEQNYPNPFNPSTTIAFNVEQAGPVTLRVFNTAGQQVQELYNGMAMPGIAYTVTMDGSQLSSGTYFYSISTPTHKAVKKMMLVK